MVTKQIVEHINQGRIFINLLLDDFKDKVKLLSENKDVFILPKSRLIYKAEILFDAHLKEDAIIREIKKIAAKREEIASTIDVKRIWEHFKSEKKTILLKTICAFYFKKQCTQDEESAIIRALFNNRIYFKFQVNTFIPNSEEELFKIKEKKEKVLKTQQFLDEGVQWLKDVIESQCQVEPNVKMLDTLASYYIHEKQFFNYKQTKQILNKAKIKNKEAVFDILVKYCIFDKDEDINLHRYRIPTAIKQSVVDEAKQIATAYAYEKSPERRDFSHLEAITIDGQSTRDFDDAITLDKAQDHYIVGVHITDVANYIKKKSALDQDAFCRVSSIYTPDRKVPMIPEILSEDICSLKMEQLRPTISVIAKFSKSFEILDYEICASQIIVKKKYSYFEANKLLNNDEKISTLHKIALSLREKRLQSGALQINIPEINLWLSDNLRDISILKIDEQSPARLLIAEMMILCNHLIAKSLQKNNVPAIFRGQKEPIKRFYSKVSDSLFLNYTQKRFINRVQLNSFAKYHSGLGLSAYTTATSPLRKYIDLVTQRQVRGMLGFSEAYSVKEIQTLFKQLEEKIKDIAQIQSMRKRYWILKHLESKKGHKESGIVIDKRKNHYLILLKEYILEYELYQRDIRLEPGDLVFLTIQHVDARGGILSMFL